MCDINSLHKGIYVIECMWGKNYFVRWEESVMTQNEMLKVIYDDVQSLKGGFRELTDKVQVLDGNVKDLQLTLENETNRNIRIIA